MGSSWRQTTGSVTPTNSLKITAKQKCKSSNIINEGFYVSGTSLDHNVTPAWTEAWEEQSWLSVTVINDLAHPPHVGGSSLITTSVPARNVSNLWLLFPVRLHMNVSMEQNNEMICVVVVWLVCFVLPPHMICCHSDTV